MKRLLPLILLALSANAIADDNWNVINDNDSMEIAIMKGSFKRIKGNNTMLGRFKNHKENNVTLIRWSVSDAECLQRFGKIYALDIGTSKVQWDNDFAFESGSIGSFVAEVACIAGGKAPSTPAVKM